MNDYWTPETLTAPTATTAPTAKPDIDKFLLFGGAGAVALGTFLPYVTAPFIGSVNLLGMSGLHVIDGLLLLIGVAAVIAGALGVEQVKRGWVTLVVGILAAVEGLWGFIQVTNAVSECRAEIGSGFGDLADICNTVQVGAGVWLLALGGIALGVFWFRARKNA